jgi:hypothetical protein
VRAALAAALLWLIFAPAQPADAQACATGEAVAALLRENMPDAAIQMVSDGRAERLRAGISDLTGEDVPEGGSYLVAQLPDGTSHVVRFVDGCATHHGRFPTRLLRSWLDGSPA